jgi:hypothetical protein
MWVALDNGGQEAMTNYNRRVTNVDPLRGPKKQIWYLDTASEREDIYGGPSRYGPTREVVATCFSVEDAAHVVELWNSWLEMKDGRSL